MLPNQPDRKRSARHGIERDFAFERFLWQGLSMQCRYGGVPGSALPQTTGFSPIPTHVSSNSSKIAGTIPYVEIAAPQCLAPLVDLAGKARKIETKNDY